MWPQLPISEVVLVLRFFDLWQRRFSFKHIIFGVFACLLILHIDFFQQNDDNSKNMHVQNPCSSLPNPPPAGKIQGSSPNAPERKVAKVHYAVVVAAIPSARWLGQPALSPPWRCDSLTNGKWENPFCWKVGGPLVFVYSYIYKVNVVQGKHHFIVISCYTPEI